MCKTLGKFRKILKEIRGRFEIFCRCLKAKTKRILNEFLPKFEEILREISEIFF